MNQRNVWIATVAALATSLGCLDSGPVDPESVGLDEASEPSIDLPEMARYQSLAQFPDGGVAELTRGASLVVLPAGSVDALQGAIDAAGPGGAVVLRSGAHTESDGVSITHPVSIVGEPGAVLNIGSDADPGDIVLDAALWVFDTHHVTIWGLEIRPTGPVGGAAIVIEESSDCVIGFNRIHDHQNSILLHHGDRASIWGNRIVVTGLWQTGELAEADGIIAMNGNHVKILANDVSNGVFGVFASDRNGTLVGNRSHGNLIGVIFCKVPGPGFQLPSGAVMGSEESASSWTATLNNATGNLDAGYLVIDGATENVLFANAASGNGTYDIELVGESTRFGFCTPASFDNTVRSQGRAFRDVIIKDCGIGNTVIGGDQVDTSVDPCEAPCPPGAVARGRYQVSVVR